MAMYLAGIPVYTIMLIGWWSSDAFLRYIHHKVQEFSAGVSRWMLVSDNFFTIPKSASTEDLCNHHHHHNYANCSHIGLDAQLLTQLMFALWL
jgi:hypothetical protein